MDYCIILNTTSNIDEAKKIAYSLVESKLAACVNIIPKMISIYSWKEDIWEDEEYLIIIKTRKDNFEPVKDKIKALHSYELPEIVMLKLEDGFKDYLDWIGKETIIPESK